MSSQRTGDSGPETFERRPGAGARRPANAEALLAEFREALESAGYAPHDRPEAAEPEPASGAALSRRSGRRTLATLGVAFGLAAVIGAGVLLLRSPPPPKLPPGGVETQPQAIAPPPANSAAPSADVGVAPAPPGDSNGEGAKAALDMPPPAHPTDAMAAATSGETPILAPSAASPTPPSEPLGTGLEKPDATPPSGPAASTAPGEAPKPPEKPAAKGEQAGKPAPDKAVAKKTAAKSEKAKAAEAPLPRPRPTPPAKTAEKPAVQAAAEPEPAPVAPPPPPPAPPASFAAQSVGQITHAFNYLTHLPGALIERATGQNPDGK